LQIDFDPNGPADANEYERDITAPIEPNASYVIEGEGNMTSCTKCTNDHDSKLTIDFDNDISESNENNNSYFRSISCS
jgi:subtilase family serine protease